MELVIEKSKYKIGIGAIKYKMRNCEIKFKFFMGLCRL